MPHKNKNTQINKLNPRYPHTNPHANHLTIHSIIMSNTDEVAHAPIQWYTPIKLSLPSLSSPPRCTTPLDPRGQSHIPLQDRLNARLTSKLRQKIPRLIPLETPDADPRSTAQTPVAHPGMERVSRREQLQRRQKNPNASRRPHTRKANERHEGNSW